MSNKRKTRRTSRCTKKGILSRAINHTKLAANVTEEQDWYLDTPDVRLTRIFAVVLILHVVAVGGILAFKMIDKASSDNGVQLASVSKTPKAAGKRQSTLAGRVDQGTASIVDSDKSKLAAPLRKDPAKSKQYRVLVGDTLTEIAKSLGVDPDALRAENAIQSDHALYPGRWLDIPVKEGHGTEKRAESLPPLPQAEPRAQKKSLAPPVGSVGRNSVRVYKVQSGDTVWGISRKLSVSYQDLISVNKIENPQSLQIGTELNIPSGN